MNITVLGFTNPDFNLKRMHQLYNKRIKHLLRILTFAKPECDNILQPEPRTLSHSEGLVNVNLREKCYIPSFQAQSVPNNFIQFHAEMPTVTS